MGQLLETIRRLVVAGNYVVGELASERLEERGILEWQAVTGLDDGKLMLDRPDANPNPAVEVALPDGTMFEAVWSYLRKSGVAKLVTVHYFDEDQSREYRENESGKFDGSKPTVTPSRSISKWSFPTMTRVSRV